MKKVHLIWLAGLVVILICGGLYANQAKDAAMVAGFAGLTIYAQPENFVTIDQAEYADAYVDVYFAAAEGRYIVGAYSAMPEYEYAYYYAPKMNTSLAPGGDILLQDELDADQIDQPTLAVYSAGGFLFKHPLQAYRFAIPVGVPTFATVEDARSYLDSKIAP